MRPLPRVRSKRRVGGRFSNGNTPSQGRRPARRASLASKLDDVLRVLIPLEQRGKVTRFLNSAKDVDTLGSLVEDIRDALMDYQVRSRISRSRPTLTSVPDFLATRYL